MEKNIIKSVSILRLPIYTLKRSLAKLHYFIVPVIFLVGLELIDLISFAFFNIAKDRAIDPSIVGVGLTDGYSATIKSRLFT